MQERTSSRKRARLTQFPPASEIIQSAALRTSTPSAALPNTRPPQRPVHLPQFPSASEIFQSVTLRSGNPSAGLTSTRPPRPPHPPQIDPPPGLAQAPPTNFLPSDWRIDFSSGRAPEVSHKHAMHVAEHAFDGTTKRIEADRFTPEVKEWLRRWSKAVLWSPGAEAFYDQVTEGTRLESTTETGHHTNELYIIKPIYPPDFVRVFPQEHLDSQTFPMVWFKAPVSQHAYGSRPGFIEIVGIELVRADHKRIQETQDIARQPFQHILHYISTGRWV